MIEIKLDLIQVIYWFFWVLLLFISVWSLYELFRRW